jgi:hypothetical protein
MHNLVHLEVDRPTLARDLFAAWKRSVPPNQLRSWLRKRE